MTDIETKLVKAGAELVRHKKHKVYKLRGVTFVVSHNTRSDDKIWVRRLEKQLKQLTGGTQ